MPSASTLELDRPAVSVPAKVTVTVSADETIVCSPDPITVKSGQGAIEFTLSTEGYVFRQKDAVVVDDPGRDFPRPSVTSACGTKATLRDRNLDRRDYKYSVYLQQVSSGRVIWVDPSIQNDPD